MEIGGLLDPLGWLWGYSVAFLLLALVPDKNIIPSRRLLGRQIFLIFSAISLVAAIFSTIYAARLGILYWSVVPSTLITAGAFFVGCRFVSAVVKRFSKKVPTSGDDRRAAADDDRL